MPRGHSDVSRRQSSLFRRAVSGCRRCPRLVAYCASFNLPENRKFPLSPYWAKPVAGFGDPEARLLIVGLAPGAHGANRTGRPFTGDAAGSVLYRALYEHGFSNLPSVSDRKDGLELKDAYITNAVKCAPPGNRPSGPEKRACLDWLREEVARLRRVRVLLALGRDAFEACLRLQRERGRVDRLRDYPFVHGCVHRFVDDSRILLSSYHFSRYNTNTGLLTVQSVSRLFAKVRSLLSEESPRVRNRRMDRQEASR